MPQERPFLTEPSEAGAAASGAAPDSLFDLAVNRAATAVRGVGSQDALAAWHARTRFARRISLAEVQRALATRPQSGEWHWQGGPDGSWQPGKARFP